MNTDRAAAKLHARALGFFWFPCPLCGTEFGGQEWKTGPDGQSCSIPVGGSLSHGTAICPTCTAEGKGDEAWAKLGVIRVG